jgi:hypothetical protein
MPTINAPVTKPTLYKEEEITGNGRETGVKTKAEMAMNTVTD